MANREHYSAKRNKYLQHNGKVFSDSRTQHYGGVALVPSPDGNKVILVNTTGHKDLIKTREA